MKSSSLLSDWKGPLPKAQGRLDLSLILPVPLSAFITINVEESLHYLEALRKTLEKLHPGRFEILLVPFGQRRPAFGLLLSRLTLATSGRKVFRWIRGVHAGPGEAVREAVFLSEGRFLLVGSLECHYDPSFFKEALERMKKGALGIQANRRLPGSEFMVPVALLSLVYRRHLLGVLLSHLWSRLLGLRLTDNLSGAYGLQRKFALRVFNRLTCPGFLYEAEMAIVAQRNKKPLEEMPASFFLEREKPRLRVYQEIFSVIRWTGRFFFNSRRGEYDFLRKTGNQLTADDWGISPGVNDGILEMVRLGHLRRVSLLAGGPYLNYRLAELKRVRGVEFGLHFNLTNAESGGGYKSPGHFLWIWSKNRLLGRPETVQHIRQSLREQLALLKKASIRPRRLEGHHHVHAVPGVLEAIQDILKSSGIRYVRVPYHRALWFSRRAPIAWLGKTVQGAARRLAFDSLPFYYPTRRDFSSFNRLVRCLNRVRRCEVIIHPASIDDIGREAPSDNYRSRRVVEFNLLRLMALEFGEKNPSA